MSPLEELGYFPGMVFNVIGNPNKKRREDKVLLLMDDQDDIPIVAYLGKSNTANYQHTKIFNSKSLLLWGCIYIKDLEYAYTLMSPEQMSFVKDE